MSKNREEGVLVKTNSVAQEKATRTVLTDDKVGHEGDKILTFITDVDKADSVTSLGQLMCTRRDFKYSARRCNSGFSELIPVFFLGANENEE